MDKPELPKPVRLVTVRPQVERGDGWLYPAGVVIDVYYATHSGSCSSPDGVCRDTWLYYGNEQTDGWWWRVRDPRHAQLMGMFRSAAQITEHLGIDMSPGNLTQVGQRFWPDEKWRAEHTPQDNKGGRAA